MPEPAQKCENNDNAIFMQRHTLQLLNAFKMILYFCCFSLGGFFLDFIRNNKVL